MIKKIKDIFINKTFTTFIIIGIINTINYNVLYLIGLLFTHYMISNIIAYIISLTISFFLNTKYTFKVKPTLIRFIKFPITGLATFITQTLGIFILVDIINVDKKISGFLASLIAIPITFIVMKYILKSKA